MLKRIATIGALLLTAIATTGVGALPALAESHPFVRSFGSFGDPNGIAIDESSGDVYVADIETAAVYKFDRDGNPVNFSSLGANALSGSATPAGSFSFPSERGTPAAIAVDNSTDAKDSSAGDLYVMDTGHTVIDKFRSDGTFIGQISVALVGETLYGLGVQANGDVRAYVRGAGSVGFEMKVDVFDDSVANAFVKRLRPAPEGQNGVSLSEEYAFALAPSGDGYAPEVECGCFGKLGGNMETLGRVDSGPADVAAAVDPATGHLFIDGESSVAEWDTGGMNGVQHEVGSPIITSTGTLNTSFGSAQLSGLPDQGGIAVNGASGDIYISDPADGQVHVFASGAPAVATGTATNLTKTTATLAGTVDPRGAQVTSCQFEYEAAHESGERPRLAQPTTNYSHTVPCDKTPGQIGSGTGPVSVTADIAGLAPGKLYHFRLVAVNAEGESPSSGLFATAGPGFGIKSFDFAFFNQDGTPDTQAGSHPFKMVTSVALNTAAIQREKVADSRYVIEPDGYVRDIITDLPPGLVGDPNATPVKCRLAQLEEVDYSSGEFGRGHCPPESQVGELEAEFGEESYTLLKEPVYNMVPPPGVAVQIGGNFVIPDTFVDAKVRAGGEYPVRAAVAGIPQSEPLILARLTVFGTVGGVGKREIVGEEERYPFDNRKPFLTLPTGCTGPLRGSVQADSYQSPGDFVQAAAEAHNLSGQPLALSGCSKLLFPPAIKVSPDTTDASTSSGLTVNVHVPQNAAFNPDGLAESALRDTTVTLPEGVAINPAGADGLEACSERLAGFTGFNEFNPEFEPGVKTPTFTPEMPSPTLPGTNFCPGGSKIGTVQIKTPLLSNPLEGAVYLANQTANPFGSLVAMYMFAEDPASGTIIKLTGEVKLSETGQIVTTFDNTPDLPFEDLELHFFGGERAPLTTPSRCGTYTTQATFVPWDGNSPVNATSSFEIDHGPHGSPCPGESLPFEPSLAAGTTSNQAGGLSPFTMTMSRDDGQQSLQSVSLKMPPGLSGLLTGVELCAEVQANAGTCGPNSLIGETIVSVGVGNDPFTVKGGRVYLTGPYKGAPFGLSIVNPAKAGPYDLGQVIVRAKIEVDPATANLTVTSDNEGPYKIPAILDGIPLQIKHVNVTVNRPGFTFDPTGCNPMRIIGSLDSTEGATSTVSVPFQATNCAALSFKPQFSVSTSGKTSRANGASLHVKLVYPKAPFGSQANIRSVKVDLPRKLPSRLETLQQACPAATFEANPARCPVVSRVGKATATTPILPVALKGPAYFVSHGGAAFPDLTIVLQGYGLTVDLVGTTFINEKTNITSTTFKQVPDVPVGTFELTLPQGRFSALAAQGSLCKSKLAMPTMFVAQSGVVIHQSTHIAVTGCKPTVTIVRHKVKGSTATIVAGVPSAGKLVATGTGLLRATKTLGAGGNATIGVSLSGSEKRFLADHPGRRLKVNVKLVFTPSRGGRLSSSVALIMG
jgi:hypothetical protein